MLIRFFRERRGNIAVMFALTLPVVISVCGFGGEVGYWYYKERNLQSAADVAAYDGVAALKAGGNSSKVRTAATTGATANGWSSSGGAITVNTPPGSGTHQDSDSVEVILTQNLPRFFSTVYSSSAVTASARSVATAAGTGVCILALSATAPIGIAVNGAGNLTANNCDVAADSSSAAAVDMTGSSQLSADCVVTVGTAVTTSGLTLNKCMSVTTHASTVADPYASVSQPTPSGTCLTVPNNASLLSPGWYCHGLATTWGPITFQPGLYMVSGGSLNLSAGTNATGTGVTFFVSAGNSTVIDGHAVVTFSAPTSGTYSGIVFFGDRTALTGINAITGGSSSIITGAIYYPTQPVTYTGGASNGTDCTQIVAGTITFTGNSYFNHTCPGSGESNFYAMDGQAGSMRTVE